MRYRSRYRQHCKSSLRPLTALYKQGEPPHNVSPRCLPCRVGRGTWVHTTSRRDTRALRGRVAWTAQAIFGHSRRLAYDPPLHPVRLSFDSIDLPESHANDQVCCCRRWCGRQGASSSAHPPAAALNGSALLAICAVDVSVDLVHDQQVPQRICPDRA